MADSTLEAIEKARLKVAQAKVRLQALEARASTLNRKADARRKIILGGLLLDAAMKDAEWEARLNELIERISRDQDRKAFAGWTFKGGTGDG
ncbi:mobilization protein [Sphingomonas sp. TREG-RG-20F-R18-01]|uniref:mobilization protein n=1 Tax=Sphingomonas sp. TREG-RG-20F-R18-01 TaxID=2914982 RepID=UPI001F55AC77|nr:mobilization protein [Sphingomonas sp. TREG-RG-20F-R18-01]